MAGIGNAILFAQGLRLQPSTSPDIVQMQKTVNDVSSINFTGDPNGNVSANPSSMCHDPSAGNVYLKQTGTGNTGWVAVGAATILTAQVTLTSTQLKALHVTPVVFIPSQGAGTIFAPLSFQTKFVCPTGEAFGASDDISVMVDPSSLTQTYAQISSVGFAGPTVDTYCTNSFNQLNVISASDFEDTDMILFCQNGTITGNPADDNTLICSCIYRVMQLL